MDNERPSNTQTESITAEAGATLQVLRLEGEGVKSLVNVLIIFIVALMMTVPLSCFAIVMVLLYKDSEDQKMDDLRWSNRQNTYWAEQVSSKLDKTFPPLPDFASHQPRRR